MSMDLSSLPARVLDKIAFEPESGCWLWTGGLTGRGYGGLWVDGHMRSAHRVLRETLVGPVPQGFELDHKCRIRSCVNPDHVEPVTHRVNMRRSPIAITAINMRKERCKMGHKFELIRFERSGRARRVCLVCDRAKWARWKRRKKTRTV